MADLLDPDAADLTLLQDRQVAVLGYGPVAAAHALNLRDSGVDVCVGLPPESRGAVRAEMDGLLVLPPARACARADLVLLPAGSAEEAHEPAAAAVVLEDALEAGDMVVVTAGAPVRFGGLRLPAGVDLAMLRSLADGPRMRAEYLDGRGAPALVGVGTDATGVAWPVLTAYAAAVGALRSGALVVGLTEEAEAARFAAVAVHDTVQAVAERGFEVLVGEGVGPEVAYLACLHELKSRVDAVHAAGFAAQHGPDGGAGREGSGVLDAGARDRMHAAWRRVHEAPSGPGTPAEPASPAAVTGGTPAVSRRSAARQAHPIEHAGRRVRALMSWIR